MTVGTVDDILIDGLTDDDIAGVAVGRQSGLTPSKPPNKVPSSGDSHPFVDWDGDMTGSTTGVEPELEPTEGVSLHPVLGEELKGEAGISKELIDGVEKFEFDTSPLYESSPSCSVSSSSQSESSSSPSSSPSPLELSPL